MFNVMVDKSSTKEPTPTDDIKPKVEQQKVEATPPPAAPQSEPPVDNTPKTWAHRVGGGVKPAAPVTATAPAQKPSPAPATTNVPSATRPQQQTPRPHAQTNGGPIAQGERRIYLGGIIRNMVPDTTSIAEQEIKDAFSSRFRFSDHRSFHKQYIFKKWVNWLLLTLYLSFIFFPIFLCLPFCHL
ncbi:unnamed protein product [Strongylus vulgaris]|uniref:Uncharacterized protein n=1 Tax=Strongylus vulgaris TaxID=40348 RepID=A0A3P7KTP6_STRVU|nr:unnamed protein product [Strongylus vulgaris]